MFINFRQPDRQQKGRQPGKQLGRQMGRQLAQQKGQQLAQQGRQQGGQLGGYPDEQRWVAQWRTDWVIADQKVWEMGTNSVGQCSKETKLFETQQELYLS